MINKTPPPPRGKKKPKVEGNLSPGGELHPILIPDLGARRHWSNLQLWN